MTLTDPDQRTAVVDVPRDCTFDPADFAIIARYWYPIALSRELSTAPLAATLLDEPLVVYRAGDAVAVANDIYPHRGVPLSAGTGDGRSVACAYHGIRYGARGACVSIPAHPGTKIPARLTLRTYPAVERGESPILILNDVVKPPRLWSQAGKRRCREAWPTGR
jgi:vanillate O-demethylase monooxygenase subunit